MPPKAKTSITTLPKSWPPTIRYLTSPSYSPSLSPAHLIALRNTQHPFLPQAPSQQPNPLVKITSITDSRHPACGQAGLTAAKDLKPNTFVIEYLGIVHASSKGDEIAVDIDPHAASDYDLSLDRYAGLAIDAATSGNEARFINDYRGIRERPNAHFCEIWSMERKEMGMGVFILPEGKSGKLKAGVKKGEEIVVSYGRGFWGARRQGDVDGFVGGNKNEDGNEIGYGNS